jgi:hypothetical protein
MHAIRIACHGMPDVAQNDTPEPTVSDSVYLIKDKKHGLVAVPAL